MSASLVTHDCEKDRNVDPVMSKTRPSKGLAPNDLKQKD